MPSRVPRKADGTVIGREECGTGLWEDVRRELFRAVLETVGVPNQLPPLEALSGEAFMRLAGLASFADRIGSGFDFAPLGEKPGDYWRTACERARETLEHIGWNYRRPLTLEPSPFEPVFAYLGNPHNPFHARPLQQKVEELLADLSAPSLLLIEAPMGEGKTEAAFYAHLRMQAALEHRGMYFALPTETTGNMPFTRTVEFLEQVGHTKSTVDLQLLHGAALLNDEFQSLVVRENLPTQDEQDGKSFAVAAREWFTHQKRALLSDYGTGRRLRFYGGAFPLGPAHSLPPIPLSSPLFKRSAIARHSTFSLGSTRSANERERRGSPRLPTRVA